MKIVNKLIVFTLITGFAAIAAFAQNYKITQSMSMSGQEMKSTVYVKGSRKRTESSGMMGMGADVATIEQCDLGRNLQVNDKKKLYYVQDMGGGSTGGVSSGGKGPAGGGPVTKGGTITQTSAITDTGERKQMFGLTARHIKTTMTMESSPDACDKNNMSMETDGWYVDLPQFSCPISVPRNPYQAPRKSGCQDKTIVKSSGSGKLGFALEMTTTLKTGGSEDGFSQTITTVDFSKATLEDALFNVPADYKLANSPQDLYGKPDLSAMMRGGNNNGDNDSSGNNTSRGGNNSGQNTTSSTKRPGVKRIGVLAPTNRTGENISTTNLQAFLVQNLTTGNVEAVSIGSEADARAAGCDFILSSDFSKLKQSTAGKIGGMFGKVTNTNVSGMYDAQVDYKLVSLNNGQTTLQNKAASKTESNLDRAAEGVLAQEAGMVASAAGKQ